MEQNTSGEDKGYSKENAAMHKPLTSWPNEPTVADLKQDLADAKSGHDQHITKVNNWLDNLNITGSAKLPKSSTRSRAQPKVIRKNNEWRYSSLSEPFLSTDDVFNASPTSASDKKSAVQNGLVLNHQFNNQIDKTRFIDEYIRTAVDEGTVIVKLGWEFEEDTREVERPVYAYRPNPTPEFAQIDAEIHATMEQDPETFESLPAQVKEAHNLSMEAGTPYEPFDTGETQLVEEVITIKNQPSIEVCDYRNVIIDPTCKGDVNKAEFAIYSFETSLSQLKKEGDKYSNLDKIKEGEHSILGDEDHWSKDDESFNFTDSPRKKFIAYEYWGYWDYQDDGTTRPFVATWVGDTMIRMEENPFPDEKIPFITAQYLPVRRSIYGEPDGELLEDNQKIIGAVTRGMIDIMARSANGQVGTRIDALDVTNKRKFDKGMDYEFNATVDPNQAFHMHKYPEIPQAAPLMLQYQNSDAESLTGVKAFSGPSGISGNALGDSVGGAKSALDATAKRELGILRRMAAGIKMIGIKIAAMNQEFLSDEETVRITEDEFAVVERDDLYGNFDLKLDISTPEADEAKASQLAFMLQTMGPNEDPGMRQMLLSEIATLRKMPDLARRIIDYKPEPDPIAQETRQFELELLKAQVANEQAKASENEANGMLDQARANEIQARADKTNLDYAEQESGVTQERDLQKQGAQAEANLDRDLAKHALSRRDKVMDSATNFGS